MATELPTTGADASAGCAGTERRRARGHQANTANLLNGCKVDLVTKDDPSVALGRHDPNLGARNMAALASNRAVVGVLGPLNPTVCPVEMPIANRADLVQMSPAAPVRD